MVTTAHGFIGTHLSPFTDLLPSKSATFGPSLLAELANLMRGKPDSVKDGDDPEENLWVPAGYTYFGQFVDHDLTFDSTSSLNPADRAPQGTHVPSNLRTPRFDLDNVYGDGPDAQPFMYEADGATLLTGTNDLVRAPNHRAIIGDKRNDENSIICQIQLGMIRYHNKIVAALNAEDPAHWNAPHDVFNSARNEVRWTYQRILVDDFLPRIIQAKVLADLKDRTPHQRRKHYALYTAEKRANLPREFVGAAYRFGHSGVRTGYRLNTTTSLSIFPGTIDADHPILPTDSLLGFEPLPTGHVIEDWGRFFPASSPGADIGTTGRKIADNTPNTAVRLQYAYKIDTTIVDPLAALPDSVAGAGTKAEAKVAIAPDSLPETKPDTRPQTRVSLALLNLLRGDAYGLPSGQSVARALKDDGKKVTVLTPAQMVVRVATDAVPAGGNPDQAQAFQWTPVPVDLQHRTPLWFYVLAEAQLSVLNAVPGDQDGVFLESELMAGAGAITQLGWVGGRIVAEVFYGLLDADPDSVFNHPAAHGFRPRLAAGGGGLLCMRNLLDF